MEQIARKYLKAVQDAGAIYRKIAEAKGEGQLHHRSVDGRDRYPADAAELLVILAALADEGVPVQTIAPKFTGRFNKGVDYVGDLAQFEKEFRDDLAVIAFAVRKFGLPANLKLSVHSGSDKFSIYPDHAPSDPRHRGRAAPQDRRHDVARGSDRPGGSGRRRPCAGEGDLREGAGEEG